MTSRHRVDAFDALAAILLDTDNPPSPEVLDSIEQALANCERIVSHRP